MSTSVSLRHLSSTLIPVLWFQRKSWTFPLAAFVSQFVSLIVLFVFVYYFTLFFCQSVCSFHGSFLCLFVLCDSHMQGSVCMKIWRKKFQLDSVHFFFWKVGIWNVVNIVVCVCACVCVCECMCAVSSVGLHPSACRKCFRLHFTIFFTVSCLAPCFNTVVPAGSHGSIDEQRAHVSMQLWASKHRRRQKQSIAYCLVVSVSWMDSGSGMSALVSLRHQSSTLIPVS